MKELNLPLKVETLNQTKHVASILANAATQHNLYPTQPRRKPFPSLIFQYCPCHTRTTLAHKRKPQAKTQADVKTENVQIRLHLQLLAVVVNI